MIIAIDWDKTITAHPSCFIEVIQVFKKWGHDVIIATGRKGIHDKIEAPHFWGTQIFYCGDRYKKDVVREYLPHDEIIWIDDEPGHIEPSRKLNFNEEQQ